MYFFSYPTNFCKKRSMDISQFKCHFIISNKPSKLNNVRIGTLIAIIRTKQKTTIKFVDMVLL